MSLRHSSHLQVKVRLMVGAHVSYQSASASSVSSALRFLRRCGLRCTCPLPHPPTVLPVEVTIPRPCPQVGSELRNSKTVRMDSELNCFLRNAYARAAHRMCMSRPSASTEWSFELQRTPARIRNPYKPFVPTALLPAVLGGKECVSARQECALISEIWSCHFF